MYYSSQKAANAFYRIRGFFNAFGLNGNENDREVKGEANQIGYGMRVHDPRLGRCLKIRSSVSTECLPKKIL